MKIFLNQPLAISELGKYENLEDSIFPEIGSATAHSKFFVVCDGVGGHSRGEVASKAVCDGLAEFFAGRDNITTLDKHCFNEALDRAYAQLEKEDNPEDSPKMGTTLTFVYFHEGGALAAHIGDSRIYHLRPQPNQVRIIYRSNDHSHVSELVRAGVITEKEAAVHPKRNILTRVMQPAQQKPAVAYIEPLDDIATGDYFFLCTDGILESISDELLCDIIGRNISDEAKMAQIKEICQKESRDNYSAYLIPISKVEGRVEKKIEKIDVADNKEQTNKPKIAPEIAKPRQKAGAGSNFYMRDLFFFLAGASIMAIVVLLIGKWPHIQKNELPPATDSNTTHGQSEPENNKPAPPPESTTDTPTETPVHQELTTETPTTKPVPQESQLEKSNTGASQSTNRVADATKPSQAPAKPNNNTTQNTNSDSGITNPAIAVEKPNDTKPNPKAAEAAAKRGQTNFNQGKFKSALVEYNSAISLNPDNAEYYRLRGEAYDALGDKQKATVDFEKAKALADKK
ncbi:MAG: protein phosphatase 2C domain-containing protein [Holophagaceae bacterium]|nr:protein phosphatase 2C domain-containing protein [Holophagaceae bacterium]